MEARLRIIPKTYRGEAGYSIIGIDTLGRRVSIFTRTRRSAEAIRDAVKAGPIPVTAWERLFSL